MCQELVAEAENRVETQRTHSNLVPVVEAENRVERRAHVRVFNREMGERIANFSRIAYCPGM